MSGCEDAGAEGGDSNDLWWLGVLISILSSIGSNLGVNVQKYSLMQEALRPPSKRRPYIFQPYWFFGLWGVILGSIGDFVALGFAAQSLITPVGGFTMVANVFFAHFWLKEKLSRSDLIGTGLIVMGVVLIAAFADKSESCFTLDELVDLYGEPPFLTYATLVCSFSFALYFASKRIEETYHRYGAWSKQYSRVKGLHKCIYPTLSGVLGAQTVLFAKSTAELVKSTAQGDNQFDGIITYIIMFCMFCTIFMQLHWLAVGLKWFDAVYVIPVFQCFFITVTILGGAVYFKELSSFGTAQFIFFPMGVVLIIAGIFMLSQREMNAKLPAMRRFVFVITFMNRLNRATRRRAAKSARLLQYSCLCSCHKWDGAGSAEPAGPDSVLIWKHTGSPKLPAKSHLQTSQSSKLTVTDGSSTTMVGADAAGGSAKPTSTASAKYRMLEPDAAASAEDAGSDRSSTSETSVPPNVPGSLPAPDQQHEQQQQRDSKGAPGLSVITGPTGVHHGHKPTRSASTCAFCGCDDLGSSSSLNRFLLHPTDATLLGLTVSGRRPEEVCASPVMPKHPVAAPSPDLLPSRKSRRPTRPYSSDVTKVKSGSRRALSPPPGDRGARSPTPPDLPRHSPSMRTGTGTAVRRAESSGNLRALAREAAAAGDPRGTPTGSRLRLVVAPPLSPVTPRSPLPSESPPPSPFLQGSAGRRASAPACGGPCKQKIRPRGTPRVVPSSPIAMGSPMAGTLTSGLRSPLSAGTDGGRLPRNPSGASGEDALSVASGRQDVLLRAGSADEAVDTHTAGALHPPVPLIATDMSEMSVMPFYEQDWFFRRDASTTALSTKSASVASSGLRQRRRGNGGGGGGDDSGAGTGAGAGVGVGDGGDGGITPGSDDAATGTAASGGGSGGGGGGGGDATTGDGSASATSTPGARSRTGKSQPGTGVGALDASSDLVFGRREDLVLQAAGGELHRITSHQRLAGSSNSPATSARHLHTRSRMPKPLAPLPSGVMVGAGLEAAAQLGKSFFRRMFGRHAATGVAPAAVTPTATAAPDAAPFSAPPATGAAAASNAVGGARAPAPDALSPPDSDRETVGQVFSPTRDLGLSP